MSSYCLNQKPKYGFGRLVLPGSPHESVSMGFFLVGTLSRRLIAALTGRVLGDAGARRRLDGDTLMASKLLHILPACFLKSEQVKDVAAAPNIS